MTTMTIVHMDFSQMPQSSVIVIITHVFYDYKVIYVCVYKIMITNFFEYFIYIIQFIVLSLLLKKIKKDSTLFTQVGRKLPTIYQCRQVNRLKSENVDRMNSQFFKKNTLQLPFNGSNIFSLIPSAYAYHCEQINEDMLFI